MEEFDGLRCYMMNVGSMNRLIGVTRWPIFKSIPSFPKTGRIFHRSNIDEGNYGVEFH